MRSFSLWLMGIALFLFPLEAAHARAQAGQAGDLGVGGLFGSPTGLSLKYWLNETSAVDGALAWKFGDRGRFQMHTDYLWHHNLPASVRGRLPFYLGGGLRVLAGYDAEAGIRFPIGVSYLFPDAPFEVFAEVVPILDFAPATEGDVDGGVGVRFYFTP